LLAVASAGRHFWFWFGKDGRGLAVAAFRVAFLPSKTEVWPDSSIFSFPGRSLRGAPNTGGGSHKKEGLSNRGGVPGVPGEEIWSKWRFGAWALGNENDFRRKYALRAWHGKFLPQRCGMAHPCAPIRSKTGNGGEKCQKWGL